MSAEPYLYTFLHVAGFALWSSFWPRRFVKGRIEPLIGFKAYRIFYNAGTIFLFGASWLYLFQHSAETQALWHWRGEPWLRPLVYAIEGLGIFFLAGVGQLGLSFWGLKNPPADTLTIRGYYKITRHPLYWSVFCLFLGHTLVLGTALALFYLALMELYNVLGVRLFETPALIEKFGQRYRDYQRQVSTVPFLSIIQGKVHLTGEDVPLATLLKTALFISFIALIHRPVFVFLTYYLPTLGHVSEKFLSEWERVIGPWPL